MLSRMRWKEFARMVMRVVRVRMGDMSRMREFSETGAKVC